MNFKISGTIVVLGLLFLCTIFFKWGFERLQERRYCELDKITKQDNPRKSYLPAAFHSITKKTMPEAVGLVKGIVYSKNLPSTVISENNGIVHEDNTIHGVTIVKIHKDKVEFAKNGQKWTQKVGETPNPEWYN